MKKILLSASLLAMLFSCQSEDSKVVAENNAAARQCASQEVLERQLREDPEMALRMNKIEEFTENFTKNNPNYRLVNGQIEIPVVVNVIIQNCC